jgi:hypothetical protein
MKTTKSIVTTSGCIVQGAHAEAGSFHTLDNAEALTVIGAGRARLATEEEIAAAAKPAVAPVTEPAAPAEPAREAASAAPATEPAAPAATAKRRRA